MKFYLRYLALSLAGLLVILAVVLLPWLFSLTVPDLARKFLLLAGCMMFGYGIAMVIVEWKTPK